MAATLRNFGDNLGLGFEIKLSCADYTWPCIYYVHS